MVWGRVQHLDRRLMRRSIQSRSPALDRMLVGITRPANYSRLWLVIVSALALFGGRRGRTAAGVRCPSDVAAGAAIGIGSGVLAACSQQRVRSRPRMGCRRAEVVS